jgi:hypothetical protein
VSRETLAVFLQVRLFFAIFFSTFHSCSFPQQPNHEEVIAQNGESFGEFTTRVFKRALSSLFSLFLSFSHINSVDTDSPRLPGHYADADK